MVDKLLYFTINRGMLFAFVQVGRMVAYIPAPEEFFWYAINSWTCIQAHQSFRLPFHLLLSKLHTNSLRKPILPFYSLPKLKAFPVALYEALLL